jgi:hypothetical protein
MKVFVPFCEELIEQHGFGLGELVPFRHEYQCYSVELLGPDDRCRIDAGVPERERRSAASIVKLPRKQSRLSREG